MTPGTYLRRRREAAGLSTADVASIIAAPGSKPSGYEIGIRLHEGDALIRPCTPYLFRVRQAFRFDPFLFLQIADGRHPLPPICRVCGCSDLDPCDDEIHGACGWAAADLCTACESHPAAGSSAGLSTGE